MSELRELSNISLPFGLDNRKNYIYIKDAKRENKYFCPCCGKELITAAIDEDKEYKVPAYYRHKPNEKCDAESLAHWVYKIWLFDKGSQFYVFDGAKKDLYTVENIDIEKTFHTDFGDYRPDITITTTENKIFFFEINFSNPKRSDDYFLKWCDFNYDVIEVDIMKLQKESFNNKIPTFRLIYSNGVCYDSKYNKKDVFAGITKELIDRKEEIKRQDMLNYKIVWEKLDWFWNEIKKYKALKSTMDDVLNSFREVPYEEMEMCFNIVKRISCINNNQGFRDVINEVFKDKIENLILKYNIKTKNKATFDIYQDDDYRTIWYAECFIDKNQGVLNSTKHCIEKDFVWRKHYYPFEFFNQFVGAFEEFFEYLSIHNNYINEINIYLKSLYTKEELNYHIETFNNCYNFSKQLLITNENKEDLKYEIINNISKNKRLFTKYKINKAIDRFNKLYCQNECEYFWSGGGCENIYTYQENISYYELINNNKILLFEHIFYLNDNPNSFYDNFSEDDILNNLIDIYKNKINTDYFVIKRKLFYIIDNLEKILFKNNSYFYLKVNYEKAFDMKINIFICANGSCHKGLEFIIDDSFINDEKILYLNDYEIKEKIYEKLLYSKQQAINEANLYNGIGFNQRTFFYTKGENYND